MSIVIRSTWGIESLLCVLLGAWAVEAAPIHFSDLVPYSNTVYAASDAGLIEFELDGSCRRVWRQADGLASDSVLSLHVAYGGVVWAATVGGVTVLSNGCLRSYTTRDGLNDDCSYCIGAGPDGVIYVGTHRGVSRLRGEQFEPFDDTHEFCRRPTYDIHLGPDGSLWFAKANALTRYVVSGTWQTFQRNPLDQSKMTRLVSNSLLALETDSVGRLWIGTQCGLGMYDGETWTEILYRERFAFGKGLLDNRIETVAVDANGWLWLAYGSSRDFEKPLGVTRMKNDEWLYLTTAEGLPSDCVNRIRVDDSGRVWLATDAGGCVWDGAITTLFLVP